MTQSGSCRGSDWLKIMHRKVCFIVFKVNSKRKNNKNIIIKGKNFLCVIIWIICLVKYVRMYISDLKKEKKKKKEKH